ncbi:MAG: HD domain-containing protein [bacterium]|nr:HD domain-containing protein [bacterium]
MTISDLYTEYRILPNLQTHMYRVAAVGELICRNMRIAVDQDSVVTACLLHDMGNIIKFNMSYRPEDFQPEGVEYWQKVKDEFVQKYGSDESKATILIAGEIGVREPARTFIREFGFAYAEKILKSDVWEHKIAEYSDERVTPTGIAPMKERLEEGRKRYLANKNNSGGEALFTRGMQCLEQIESQIFEQCDITPDAITDESIASIMESLPHRVYY